MSHLITNTYSQYAAVSGYYVKPLLGKTAMVILY
jgi:hypothetical protein